MASERLIGHVGVDSGSVVLGDPCYLVAGGSPVDPQWQDVVSQMFDPQNPGRIEGTTAVQIEGTIMTKTPAGDDMYPGSCTNRSPHGPDCPWCGIWKLSHLVS